MDFLDLFDKFFLYSYKHRLLYFLKGREKKGD